MTLLPILVDVKVVVDAESVLCVIVDDGLEMPLLKFEDELKLLTVSA